MRIALILAIAARIAMWIQGRSLWLDEQLVAINIRDNGFAALAGPQDNATAAPLGWLWLERLTMRVLGDGDRSLKLPSLLFGLGILVVAYWVGRRWLGPAGRVALVGLFAINPSMLMYSDQLKHYAADVLFGLLLLGLALAAIENPASRKRVAAFWLTAAAGLWVCMGALLIAPGLGLVIVVSAWRVRGRAAIWPHLLAGSLFLASFGGHYLLSLRFATGSAYLNTLWSFGYPPPGVRLRGFAAWIIDRLADLGANPLFLAKPALFWLAVAVGIALAFRRRWQWGAILVAPLVSAILFAAIHLVPLAVRLAQWFVPALFLAVAICADALWSTAVAARRDRTPQPAIATSERGPATREKGPFAASEQGPTASAKGPAATIKALRDRKAIAAGAALLVLAFTAWPMVARSASLVFDEPDLDDHRAIDWIIEHRRPGDLVLLAVAAVEARRWYDPGSRMGPALRIASTDEPGCDPQAFTGVIAGHRRVIAYSGVRYMPYNETYDVLRRRLAEVGTIAETRHFGKLGLVYVVDVSGAKPVPAPGACLA